MVHNITCNIFQIHKVFLVHLRSKCLTLVENFDSDVMNETREISIVIKFDMFDMPEVNFNDRGLFITQKNVDFELITIIKVTNHTEPQQ